MAHPCSRFLYVESCGQCPACKLGTGEITDRRAVIEACAGTDGDIYVIGGRLPRVTDGSRWYLPVEEQLVVSSILREFPEEFAAHLEGDCPRSRDLLAPKIVDLADGRVVYDERHPPQAPPLGPTRESRRPRASRGFHRNAYQLPRGVLFPLSAPSEWTGRVLGLFGDDRGNTMSVKSGDRPGNGIVGP